MIAYISYKDGSVGTVPDVFMITERSDLGTVTIHSESSAMVRRERKDLYSIIIDFTEGGLKNGNDQGTTPGGEASDDGGQPEAD